MPAGQSCSFAWPQPQYMQEYSKNEHGLQPTPKGCCGHGKQIEMSTSQDDLRHGRLKPFWDGRGLATDLYF